MTEGVAERRFWPGVILLLTVLAAVQVTSALRESQTWDEGTHLAAGYSYWKTGDYRMNPEHPPLGKLLNALPLVALDPRLPVEDKSWREGDQVEFGNRFLYSNRIPADAILFAGRSVTILLTLLLGLSIAVWTRAKFGAGAALFALAMYSFDPNIIAHGRYVTSDLILALFSFLACVAWARYLTGGRRRDLIASGVLLGLALASKFSAAILPFVFALLYLALWRNVKCGRRLVHMVGSMAAVGALSAAVVSVTYAPKMADLVRRPELLRKVVNRDTATGEALYQAGKRLGLPAHPYFVGLDMVAAHDKDGHESYLLGKYSQHGWWYYFPVVVAVKSPVGVLALLALAAAIAAKARRAPAVLLLPPAAFFAAAMTSHINLGVRHILPVFPFLYVAVAGLVMGEGRRLLGRALPAVAGVLLATVALESAAIYPHYLAFFNVAAGGPANGPRYLLDSNLDWGQDAKKLAIYMAEHKLPHVCAFYFGNADFSYYKIPYQYLPRTEDWRERREADCVGAISATLLYDMYVPKGSYRWLREREPMDRIGYSIYLYDLRKKR